MIQMNAKMLEVRDAGTFIPVLAVRLWAEDKANGYLLRRAGFHRDGKHVLLVSLTGKSESAYDPYDWSKSRTMAVAHDYVQKHFDELEPGDVVDVQYILGERDTPKKSERYL